MMNQAEMKNHIKKDTPSIQESTHTAGSCYGNKLGKAIQNLSSIKEEGQAQDQVQSSQNLLLSGDANLTKKPTSTEDCCAPKKSCCNPK